MLSSVEKTDEMSEYSEILEDWDDNADDQTVPGTIQPIMQKEVLPEVPEETTKTDNSRFQATDEV